MATASQEALAEIEAARRFADAGDFEEAQIRYQDAAKKLNEAKSLGEVGYGEYEVAEEAMFKLLEKYGEKMANARMVGKQADNLLSKHMQDIARKRKEAE